MGSIGFFLVGGGGGEGRNWEKNHCSLISLFIQCYPLIMGSPTGLGKDTVHTNAAKKIKLLWKVWLFVSLN